MGHKSVYKHGGSAKLAKTQEGRNWWAILKYSGMLPNDPRLRTLTLEQRNFIIESMNEDARVATGKSSDTVGGGDDSWLSVPEGDFDPLADVPIDEDELWDQVTDKVGLEQMINDEKMFKQTLANFKQVHTVKNQEINNLQKESMEKLQKLSKLKAKKQSKEDTGFTKL